MKVEIWSECGGMEDESGGVEQCEWSVGEVRVEGWRSDNGEVRVEEW